MPIAELFLGALITVLFERLASREVLNFARRKGIETQLNKWGEMLVKIQAVLADAEQKQIRDESNINHWLQSLRDLAYDVDDLLDEFAYDALAKTKRSAARGESSKIHRLGRCFGACNPRMVVNNVKVESNIEDITARFQDIVTQKDSLHLSLSDTTPSGSRGYSGDDRSTTCVVDESAIFGREKDRDAIIQLLLRDPDQVGVGVLPIIGMGGLGKTTLAQLVYNDTTVKDYFSVRAWTCVSDQFDILRITRSILESLKLTPSGTDLNSLQVQLRDALSGKKFLIILDDVWNDNYKSWDTLCVPFSSGLSGSMIIVTTRNERVASLVLAGNFSSYCLTKLSDDICKSIFLRHALGAPSFEPRPNLAEIGMEIVKRCKGLPLAAKMLGGILRNRKRPEQWQAVLESHIWDLPESGILPALKLSYHHLPPHLKRCFAYCSLFPEDYEFDKQDLILLWMAEGFLQPLSNQKKHVEELGSDFFDDLASRSFFQPSSTSSSTFVMHDLIHDLARSVASDAYLYVDNHNVMTQTAIRVRHSSFAQGEDDTFKRFEAFSNMNSLRTFLALSIKKGFHGNFLSPKVLLDLLMKPRLRVLSLHGYRIKELPNSLGQLKHLRYLNIADAQIEKLPESITSLFNLLTLILSRCYYLRELPSSIGNLVNLRYLDLDNTPWLLQMPSGIKKLTCLQKLSKFTVGKNEELGLKDLKNLPSLQGSLSITQLHNVVDVSSAVHASLNNKDGLEKLCMQWGYGFDDSRDEEIERQVMHHLQPPKSLQELGIFYYGGKQLPCWIGDSLCAPNMVRLRIYGCVNVTTLPPVGRLPLLKELTLWGLDGVTSIGDEVYGYDDPVFVGKAFPSLETLSIYKMLGWEEWSCSRGREGLHILRALSIKDCPKLKGKLPGQLPSIKRLIIENCPQLETPPITTSLASLSDLCLDKCVINQGFLQVHLSSLTKLIIANVSDLCGLNMLNSLSCLHELKIKGCPRLVSLGGISLSPTLKSLEMMDCEALEKLPLMHVDCFLQILQIEGCNSLESFPVVNEVEISGLVRWRVKSLIIVNSKKLLHGIDDNVSSIESLEFMECPSLICFPTRGKKLPSSLKSLTISDCENLQTLTEGMLMPSSLEHICIFNCPSLTCFPTAHKLPTSLKYLTTNNCIVLAAIPEALPGSSLEQIDIDGCGNLKELPESLVQYNLKKVRLSTCENLRSLPNQMNSLASLVDLEIDYCPGLRWSNIPQGGGLGLPLNLTSLTIGIGRTLFHDEKDMSKWGLDSLTSLKSLRINGKGMDDVISFPEYEYETDDGKCFLPTSITELTIGNFNNLESLSNGLQNLVFLEQLERLVIYECPKLRSLPWEGLSSTLERLVIYGCPNVEKRCKKDGGDYWPFIFHIPYVCLGNEMQ